ncbi:5-bromo-4-chloroindolyl phosphate hydrolysis family protein [Alloiococcus sp. CFN-8]|uniref:5-bromo-4-chloroindolyl phosphate hydrolysis family protein n=1 Tax=Alloiococcus sp. CFN-8 TaxID=3416081 RepID=UPI003CEBD9AF
MKETHNVNEKGITREEIIPSALPYYFVGAVWLLYAMILPMYKWYHFIIVLLISIGVYIISSKAIPPKKVKVFIPFEPILSGDKAADELLITGRGYVGQLEEIVKGINKAQVVQEINKIISYLHRIFDHIAEKPEKARMVRRMVNFYLPSVVKILDSYEDMENQSISSENISSAMGKIERSLPDITKAMEKQLDALFMDEAMDISTDLTVLERLLSADGLRDKDSLNNKKNNRTI